MSRLVLKLSLIIGVLRIAAVIGHCGPCFAQVVAAAPNVGTSPEVSISNWSAGRNWNEEWLKATPEGRVEIAEEIGEKGARFYAQQHGYQVIFDGKGRVLRQGPDQVYLDPRTGETVVIEAKGGTSPLGRGYGYEQGTRCWAVKAAEQVLHSPNASQAERKAAEQIIRAAQSGKLRVEVVRTPHSLGVPGAPVMERVASGAHDAQQAAKLAEEIGTRLRVPSASARGAGGSTFRGHKEESFIEPLEKGPVTAKQLSSSVNELKSASRAVTQAEKGLAASRTGASAASKMANRGATIAAEEAAGMRTLGKVAAPIAVAVDAGLRIWEANEVEEAYQRGEITRAERDLQHAKNVTGYIGGWAGAWAGAEMGGCAGAAIGTAICPGLGTAIGGFVGGLAGAVGGYFAGEKIAEAGTEAIMTYTNKPNGQ